MGAYIEASNIASIAAQKVVSGAAEQATSIASAFVSQLAIKSVVYEIGKQVLIGTLRETVEEIVVDGLFETAIQSAVRMVGGPNDMGHWISTLFTSTRESMNLASITGHFGSQTQQAQGFAGHFQTAMGLSTDFQAIVGEMMDQNIDENFAHVVAANEQFLTAQMAEIGLIGETLQDSKISVGRLLATGIFTGLFLLTPSLAGFNIYGASKLVGGIGSKIDAKIQNMFLAARNSKMLLKDADDFEKQEVEMGKKPISSQSEDISRENTPVVSNTPEVPNTFVGRTFVESAIPNGRSLFGIPLAQAYAHRGYDDNGVRIREEQARVETNQKKIEEMKNTEEDRDKNIVEQLEKKKQQIFDDIELLGFDPHNQDLKYPLNDYDNIQSILFKTLLNLIYENKGTLETVYKGDTRFEFTDDGTINNKINYKDLINRKNLAVILGVSDKTSQGWLRALDNPERDFTLSSLNIRRMKDSLNNIFDHIRLKEAQVIIDSLIHNYIELRFTGGEHFVTRLLTLIDEYTDFGVLSEMKINSKLQHNHYYLGNFRNEDVNYKKLSSFFNLIVGIYKDGENNFGFTDANKFLDFKQKITQLTYMHLVNEKIIEDTALGGLKFYAMCLTLHALTKLRYQNPANLNKFINHENPKGFYTIAELSKKIANSEKMIQLRFKRGTSIFELGSAFGGDDGLQAGIDINIKECAIAMTAINRYLKIERAATYRIGLIMHRLYEQVVIKYLRSKGVDSAHEVLVNYPRGFRIDSIIKINDLFRKEIEAKQGILSIPKHIELLAVDYTYTSNIRWILEKLDKHYQSGNRMLLIVLLGDKNDQDMQHINAELQRAIQEDSGERHLENVRIITSEEYKEFLGFDGQFADDFDRYQEYSFSIFRSGRTLDKIRIESEMARNYLASLSQEEAWINAYLRQS